MGKMLINQSAIEVSTIGELVETGAFVEIIKIENNKIYVKQISL